MWFSFIYVIHCKGSLHSFLHILRPNFFKHFWTVPTVVLWTISDSAKVLKWEDFWRVKRAEHYIVQKACLHHCSADVSLRAAGSPNHLFKFDEISQTLENGDELTFSAMVFLCAGAREESFASIGGHITSNCPFIALFIPFVCTGPLFVRSMCHQRY